VPGQRVGSCEVSAQTVSVRSAGPVRAAKACEPVVRVVSVIWSSRSYGGSGFPPIHRSPGTVWVGTRERPVRHRFLPGARPPALILQTAPQTATHTLPGFCAAFVRDAGTRDQDARSSTCRSATARSEEKHPPAHCLARHLSNPKTSRDCKHRPISTIPCGRTRRQHANRPCQNKKTTKNSVGWPCVKNWGRLEIMTTDL